MLDNEDQIKDHYERQKPQIDKYYKQRRLDRLQQKLASFINTLGRSIDLNFSTYIKKKTGYDIDIFDSLRKRVDTILSQNKITNDKEENDVGTMLRYFSATSSSPDKVDTLKSLLLEYSNKRRKKKNEYSECISRIETEGIEKVEISFSTGPKPKHFSQVEAISPDGLRKLLVMQWSDGNQASTTVTLQFANGASGAIYAVKGIHFSITASWKDDFTFSVKTKNDYDIL